MTVIRIKGLYLYLYVSLIYRTGYRVSVLYQLVPKLDFVPLLFKRTFPFAPFRDVLSRLE